MRRSFLKQALVVLASCGLFLPIALDYGVTAQAATITISDQNCDSFTLTGTAPNQSLTCVVSSAPACTVTGPTTGQTGSPITLIASCSPAATSWVWTGGTCASSVTSTCQDTQNVTGVVHYTVKGSNAIGTGNVSPTFDVTWSNSPPPVPTGCSISGAPGGSQSAGVQVTLTINCNGGGQPNAWTWTGGGAAGAATQTVGPIAVNTTTNFTAKASADGGATFSSAAQATVTIGGGGGGGGGPIACPNVPGTTTTIDMAWGGNVLANTAASGPLGPNDAIVVRFTTSSITSSTATGQINAYEYQGPTTARMGALSDTPCDFTAGLPMKGGGVSAFAGDVGPSISFMLVAQKSGAVTLLPSTTYYFNLKNFSGCSSPTGSCDMQVHLHKPSGS